MGTQLDHPVHEGSKEERILEAAADVFIEKGLNGTRMWEIADRAGINKTLLHYYFRSKENIYRKILERVFAGFFAQIDAALTDGRSFPSVLREFIDGIFEITHRTPKVPLFMMQELSQGGNTVREVMVAAIGSEGLSLPERFFALIQREIVAGTIAPVDPAQLMITLLGSCIWYFTGEPIVVAMMNNLDPKHPFDRERFLEKRKSEIFDVLYYGIKKRSSVGES